MPKTGRYFNSGSTKQPLQCLLCQHTCAIPAGGFGLCKIRKSTIDGASLELPFYGVLTALALDPIEKKPLYHFRPASRILSAGFVGCNLHCPFCQNHEISQIGGLACTNRRFQYYSPAKLIDAAVQSGFKQLAYTYSEPLIHIEYLIDCMTLAHEQGIANVLVSNGCVKEAAAHEVLALTDAANIDLKCFNEATYERVLGGNLALVCNFITLAAEMGVHLELTTLVVPGLNDSAAELEACLDFIAGLSRDLPWHLSAYHPAYKWTAPATDPAALIAFALHARKRLPYVYTGNIPGGLEDSSCPHCGHTLVKRSAYRHVERCGLVQAGSTGFVCAACKEAVPFKA
ncbi:AmmeMemoRadiSam system radical SAM enzyme [Breznakiellaceae bacterium SP9]